MKYLYHVKAKSFQVPNIFLITLEIGCLLVPSNYARNTMQLLFVFVLTLGLCFSVVRLHNVLK